MIRTILAALFLLCLSAGVVGAGRDIRVERVQFETGKHSVVIENSITGYAIIDYVLGARQGQYMNVSMATDKGSSYFNILAPGEDQVAMFNGSIHQNQYEGILPETGDYKVRVYMMRSAARRNEAAQFRLEMIITQGQVPMAKEAAERAGMGNFDATGKIPCSQHKGQPTQPCDFGVAREDKGAAVVLVTRPDGGKRVIFFVDGKASSADASQADAYGEFNVERENDLNLIRIGDERYEIPDAVVDGG